MCSLYNNEEPFEEQYINRASEKNNLRWFESLKEMHSAREISHLLPLTIVKKYQISNQLKFMAFIYGHNFDISYTIDRYLTDPHIYINCELNAKIWIWKNNLERRLREQDLFLKDFRSLSHTIQKGTHM